MFYPQDWDKKVVQPEGKSAFSDSQYLADNIKSARDQITSARDQLARQAQMLRDAGSPASARLKMSGAIAALDLVIQELLRL